jgi:hypothetical protein
MSGKRVIVTVDRRNVRQLEDELARLKRAGLQVEQLDTVLGVTYIVGRYDGDIRQLNGDGVVAETEGWMTQM